MTLIMVRRICLWIEDDGLVKLGEEKIFQLSNLLYISRIIQLEHVASANRSKLHLGVFLSLWHVENKMTRP